MFDHNTNAGYESVLFLLLRPQFFALGFLLGLERDHLLRFIALKSRVFVKRNLLGVTWFLFIHDLFVVVFSFVSLAQVTDFSSIDAANKDILDRVRFFFPL